jgi:L-fuculose-phosphate aldolase
MDHKDLREEVAATARRMISSGLVKGTSGNVSARTPEGDDVLVTPSGLDYADLGPEDVVLVDLDGNLLDGAWKPSTETPMHTGIYRVRSDVGGIVHTHARYSTTLACLGWEIPPVHYMLTTLSDDGRVPLAPYVLYGTEELARRVVEALGESNSACLLRNHGTIAVGESPAQAFARTEVLEEMAELYYRARVAGEPVLLTPEEVAEVAAKISGYGKAKSTSEDG